MDLGKLTLSDKIVSGTAIVLLIDLLLFPWHHISVSFGGISASSNRSALESPNALWGLLAFLLTAAVLTLIILDKLTSVELPDIGIPTGQAVFFATSGAFVFLLLKLVLQTSYLGIGAWLAILLSGAMAYGGLLAFKDANGGLTKPAPPDPGAPVAAPPPPPGSKPPSVDIPQPPPPTPPPVVETPPTPPAPSLDIPAPPPPTPPADEPPTPPATPPAP